MILDTMTYSIIALIAVFSFFVILLTYVSGKPTR